MSKATKRKHVAKEVLDDYVVPDPNQQIVKVSDSVMIVQMFFKYCYRKQPCLAPVFIAFKSIVLSGIV